MPSPDELERPAIEDDRLRLVFTCCHPALPREAQVALTLRTLLGLETGEIALAFMVPVPTMAQRLVRAKARLREASVPYEVPGADELPERVDAVVAAIYLVFNEGYAATEGDDLIRHERCGKAIRLGRLLAELMPDRGDPAALLALMALTDARREARMDCNGEVVLLEDPDRSRWDRCARDRCIPTRSRPRSPRCTHGRSRARVGAHRRAARGARRVSPLPRRARRSVAPNGPNRRREGRVSRRSRARRERAGAPVPRAAPARARVSHARPCPVRPRSR